MNVMNDSLFDPERLGGGFNYALAAQAYVNAIAEPDPEVVFPDCPKCGGQTDGYGYCWVPCDERTVFF